VLKVGESAPRGMPKIDLNRQGEAELRKNPYKNDFKGI